MNQKCLEQTWIKLKSALGDENNRTQSHRISKRSINSTRMTSSRCTSACYSSKNPSIASNQLKKIYKAKCEDMDIPILSDQESRFITYCLSNFKNRHFQMKESGLGSKSAVAIGKVLKCANFAYVDLSKNSIGDEGIFLLLKEICDSQTIAHLDVSNNDITPEGFEKISKILSFHPSIASFDISSYEGLHRNRLSTQGAEFLFKSLQANKILQFLSLSGTCLGEGIEFISQGLMNNDSLVFLDISNNAIQGKNIENLSRAIISTQLKEINLSSNKISDDGCEFLANMMVGAYEAACPLIKINLSSNNISHKGGSKLFNALRLNCYIKEFNISGNCFNKGLSMYFPSFLADNCALVSLNISCSMLKPDSLQNVAEGLVRNKRLQALNLSGNKIEDAGVSHLATGLAKNQALLSIDLSSCHIKGKGSAFLANSLRGNFVLESINLKDNSVKDEAGELFVELTRTNKNFIFIGLDLNPVHLKYVSAMKSYLKENKKLKKKQVIPKIIDEIEKIKAPIETHENLNKVIRHKLREKSEIERKYEQRIENYDEVKEKEEKRLKAMQEEHGVLRERNIQLSKNIDSSQTTMVVKII